MNGTTKFIIGTAMAAAVVGAITLSGDAAVALAGRDPSELRNDAGTWKCIIPDCFVGSVPDNGRTVDCQRRQFDTFANATVTRWRGCNVMPSAEAVGAACVPAPCSLEMLGLEKVETMAGLEKVRPR